MNTLQSEKPHVAIRHGGRPGIMVREAMEEAVAPGMVRGKRVLIKPNIGFKSVPGAGVVTSPSVVREAVRWAGDAGAAEIVVGDSCIYGVSAAEAFVSSGIAAVAREEGVRMVNLDEARAVKIPVARPFIVPEITISSVAAEAEVIISVPVMKTHMFTGATLSLKNMKGVLFKREKIRMHHLPGIDPDSPWAAFRTLDMAVADVSATVAPHIVLIDATVIMEGMGPSIGTPRRLDTVIASVDALAADLVGIEMMGLGPEQVPHLVLAGHARRRPGFSLDQVDVDRAVLDLVRTDVHPAVPEDVSCRYPHFVLTQKNACSACDSTVMAFLNAYGGSYEGAEKVQIVLGKGVTREDLEGVPCIMLGNCTAALRAHGTFLPGCPPVPSDIVKALDRNSS